MPLMQDEIPYTPTLEFTPLWAEYLDTPHVSGQQAGGCVEDAPIKASRFPSRMSAVLISCSCSAVPDPWSTCRRSPAWSVMAPQDYNGNGV